MAMLCGHVGWLCCVVMSGGCVVWLFLAFLLGGHVVRSCWVVMSGGCVGWLCQVVVSVAMLCGRVVCHVWRSCQVVMSGGHV